METNCASRPECPRHAGSGEPHILGVTEEFMKNICLALALVAMFALNAAAQDKEEDRVENAGRVMKEIMDIPDNIPQSVIDKADCVVVLPSVLKFAIGVGGSYGRGVMTCRGGKTFRGHWSAPTMMALEGGSFGLQLGGQATDFVLLLMNSGAASSILSSKVKLGGDVSAAAGPVEELPPPKPTSHCGRRYFRIPGRAGCLREYRWPVRRFVRTIAPTRIFTARTYRRGLLYFRTACLPLPQPSCCWRRSTENPP